LPIRCGEIVRRRLPISSERPSSEAGGEQIDRSLRDLVRLLARQAARELLSTLLQKEKTDVDGKV